VSGARCLSLAGCVGWFREALRTRHEEAVGVCGGGMNQLPTSAPGRFERCTWLEGRSWRRGFALENLSILCRV